MLGGRKTVICEFLGTGMILVMPVPLLSVHPRECSQQYVKTYLASNARVDTHRAFYKFQRCCLLQKLVGQHPKPFNDFFKIGYASVELNITLSWKVM